MSFRIIDLEQDTNAWLDWRMSGITATDASIIMGDNPYESVETLFLVKAGLQKAEFKMNEAIQRGKDLEPIVREKVNHHFQEDFQPACVQNLEHDFVLASLDGISNDFRCVLEIKCPSFYASHIRNWRKIDNGEQEFVAMPEYYYSQIQYQLLATSADYCLFVSYFEGDLRHSEIYSDTFYQRTVLEKVFEFWNSLLLERSKNANN